MSEIKGASNGGYNHGPGSFAHNNADRLPGQSPPNVNAPDVRTGFAGTRDPATQAQHADMGKTESQRRAELTQPKQSRAAFMDHRRRHQPIPELTMEAPLPYRQRIDWAKHSEMQRKEHGAAMNDQPRMPQQHQPMSKDQFIAQRFGDAAHGKNQTRSR